MIDYRICFFIAFNPTWKQKQDKAGSNRLFKNIIYLSETFERSIIILV